MISGLGKIAENRSLYSFLMRIRPYINKKVVISISIICLAGYNLFFCYLIARLKDQTINGTQAYAELIEISVSNGMSFEETENILKKIIKHSTNPIIITDSQWHPLMWENISMSQFSYKPLILRDKLTIEQEMFLQSKISEFKKSYKPRPLYISDNGNLMGYLVCGNNRLIRTLAIMPFFEAVLAILFILLAYFTFHNIRVTERSNLWVGLAKETAHQLGTPISSLMGWVEYIRTVKDKDSGVDPEIFIQQATRICEDMDNDLKRLKKVTARFSQIGSVPALSPCDINLLLSEVTEYFRMRLPLLRKRIEIVFNFGDIPLIEANNDLLGWVFENIIKNSIDAINRNDGKIEIHTIHSTPERIVKIIIADNGKGLAWEDHKNIFTPGFTTKKRGWGLGLTLAKRIVEDYHNGRIYVSWSHKEKGTEFCIELPYMHQNVNGMRSA